MTWRVFLTDSSQPDLDRLTPADRTALTDELFAWVSDGPPRTSGQAVAGVQLFEDQSAVGDQRHLLRRRAGPIRRRGSCSATLIPQQVSHNRAFSPTVVAHIPPLGARTPAGGLQPAEQRSRFSEADARILAPTSQAVVDAQRRAERQLCARARSPRHAQSLNTPCVGPARDTGSPLRTAGV